MTVINQHEVVGKDEDDESGKKLPRFCRLVLTLSCLVYPVYPVYQGASRRRAAIARVPRRVTGQWGHLWVTIARR